MGPTLCLPPLWMHFYSSWRVQLTVINTRAFEPYSVSSCSMDTFVQRGMSRNTQSHCFGEVNNTEHSWRSQVRGRKAELKRNLILLFTCSWGLQNILFTYKISWLIAGSSDIGFHLCELFVHCRHRDTPLRQKCSDLFPFAETSVKLPCENTLASSLGAYHWSTSFLHPTLHTWPWPSFQTWVWWKTWQSCRSLKYQD